MRLCQSVLLQTGDIFKDDNLESEDENWMNLILFLIEDFFRISWSKKICTEGTNRRSKDVLDDFWSWVGFSNLMLFGNFTLSNFHVLSNFILKFCVDTIVPSYWTRSTENWKISSKNSSEWVRRNYLKGLFINESLRRYSALITFDRLAHLIKQ